ncbi:MAG: hydroxymethylpyrimidine/phosphomethylpyrimidine kinase [Myxococcales bacterium]|nr:hydroxymethylpyrimidine/phosphomethylpyrimidine kinase [Myxococcales bacterium]
MTSPPPSSPRRSRVPTTRQAHDGVTLVAIGGLDPSGGAGLAADLDAVYAHRAGVRLVLTARTAQGSSGFAAAWPTPPAELDEVLAGLEVPAARTVAKSGMLASAHAARCAVAWSRQAGVPLVVDPVLASSSGGWLWPGLAPAAVRLLLLHEILPHAAVCTPNGPELAFLAGAANLDDPDAAWAALRALPCPAVLKGGHAPQERRGADWVWTGTDGIELPPWPPWRVNLRGSGCRFASTLALGLADGLPLVAAARAAGAFVAHRARTANGPRVGRYRS